jgi:hypothetical protein
VLNGASTDERGAAIVVDLLAHDLGGVDEIPVVAGGINLALGVLRDQIDVARHGSVGVQIPRVVCQVGGVGFSTAQVMAAMAAAIVPGVFVSMVMSP